MITGNVSYDVLDDLLTNKSKFGNLYSTPKPLGFHVQVRNLQTLKTSVSFTTAARLKDPEERMGKVPQCIIATPYAR